MLWNDTDLGDIPLTLTVVATPLPSEGTVSLNNDGSFSFVPAAEYNGTTSFSYTITDSGALPPETSETSAPVTVTVTVNPVNDTPNAAGDSYSVSEDGILNETAPGVLGNDDDLSDDTTPPLWDTLAVNTTPVTDVSNGTLTLYADGSFDYTPNADYRGPDSFEYEICDPGVPAPVLCDTATVDLTVTPVNDVPVGVGDSYSTDEDVTLNQMAPGVLGNDSGLGDIPLTLTLVATPLPSEGTVSLNNDGSFSFVPEAEYSGTTSFSYTITDSGALPPETPETSAPVTVDLTVNAVNDPPVAVTDNYSVDEDTLTPLAIAAPGVLTNDYDVDGDPFSSILISNVSNGTLSLGLDGSFTYMPNSNFNGTDTFTYEICDPSPACSSANVTIVVSPIPDPQVFISVSPSDVTLAPNDVVTFELLFGNRGPGTAYGIVISGAVTGDCTLITSNPIFSSSSMDEGVGLRTVADVQANASGGACTFTATITSTNGTTDSDSADITINGPAPLSIPPSSPMGSSSVISPIPETPTLEPGESPTADPLLSPSPAGSETSTLIPTTETPEPSHSPSPVVSPSATTPSPSNSPPPSASATTPPPSNSPPPPSASATTPSGTVTESPTPTPEPTGAPAPSPSLSPTVSSTPSEAPPPPSPTVSPTESLTPVPSSSPPPESSSTLVPPPSEEPPVATTPAPPPSTEPPPSDTPSP